MQKGKRFQIEIADFRDHEDEGRWRSYDLQAEGDTLDELLDSAVYWQTDQDGGSMGDVPADDAKAQAFIEAWFAEQSLAPVTTEYSTLTGLWFVYNAGGVIIKKFPLECLARAYISGSSQASALTSRGGK